MRVLIIEDENLAAKRIRKMVEEQEPDFTIEAITDSIESSVNWLNQHPHPDLILMDIELADGQSFEIFNQVELKSTIIFTTAYDEFAIRAFKVNSIDYLLKPIDPDELKRSFEKFKMLQGEAPLAPQKIDLDSIVMALREKQVPAYKQRFLVKQGQRLIPIDISEIAFFYTEDKVSFIKTYTDQRYMVDHSLDELEELLDPLEFFRANRQFIVSPKSLDGIHHHFNGKLKINLRPLAGEEVYVSRERAADFKQWLGEE
ncbi:MAG: response regulator transcription factor [Bacteroidia bacterium]|nr:response regulator transcription factor [Bacteroidia bacterium]